MKKSVSVGILFTLILAAFLAGRYTRRPNAAPQSASGRVLYYVDPMHPAYHSSKPGIAPDCGMPLEPVYEEENQSAKLQLSPGAVSVTPERQQLIGVQVERVEKASGTQLVRTTGRVEADDNLVYRMMAATEGWVQSLGNSPAGTLVKKNEQLATFYSEEFRNAQQAYLGSVASFDHVRRIYDKDDASRMSDSNTRINEERLRALGMGEAQIQELAKTRQTTRDITLSSPVDGIVLARNISPEQRFEKGDELYRIADLSKVWILADIYADQARALPPGARVKVTVRELDKTLYATVSQDPPLFDKTSRTLKLRLEADNPGLLLRPDMFVDLEFNAHLPAGLYIPQEAILDSGLQKIVYVEAKDDVFEPRSVEVGAAYGGRVKILRGLEEGDRVVTSGNFLIDSESRIRSASVVSGGPKADETAEMKDPVCGMPLGSKHSGHTAAYHGETYSFCSDQCQKKFEADPAKYVGEKMRSAAIPALGSRRGND